MPRRDTILVVRSTELLDDGAGGSVVAPAVPPGWTDYQIEAGGWITYWPRGRTARPHVFLHVLLVADGLASGRACFLVQGPSGILDSIAASSFRSWQTLGALRADGTAAALAVKAAWVGGGAVALRSRMAGFGDTDGESRSNEDEPA